MKINRLFVLCAALLAGFAAQSCCGSCGSTVSGDNYKIKDGMIPFPWSAWASSDSVCADPAR